MNETPRFGGDHGPAMLEYLDGEFRIVHAGAYVLCAVTGERIPLDHLRYWSVDLQEPYKDAVTAVARHRATAGALRKP